MCEPLSEVLIIRRVSIPSEYPGSASSELLATPSDCDSPDLSEETFDRALNEFAEAGLLERVVREDGEVAWIPTEFGSVVLGGWER